MGLICGSALAPSLPEAAAAFALGSVLPDLDALSRLLGKRTFMRPAWEAAHRWGSERAPRAR